MTDLKSFIEKIKADKDKQEIKPSSEEATKMGIIIPILSSLGWQIFNTEEVFPEFSVENMRVDYSLRNGTTNKVFIEAKKIGEDLERHQEQLLNYSFHQGIKLSILTNGILWWFYLPLQEGNWEQRKFYAIDIYSQDSEKITQFFIDYLERKKVFSGEALQNAEELCKDTHKKNIIKNSIPKAWDKIINEKDELLIELLAETTEKICGYKPTNKKISEFLQSKTNQERLKIESTTKELKDRSKISQAGMNQMNYNSTSIQRQSPQRIPRKIKIDNDIFEISHSYEILINTAEWLIRKGKLKRSDCPIGIGGKRYLINTIPKHSYRDFLCSKQLSNGLYMEVNLNTYDIIKSAQKLLERFGYQGNMLEVQ